MVSLRCVYSDPSPLGSEVFLHYVIVDGTRQQEPIPGPKHAEVDEQTADDGIKRVETPPRARQGHLVQLTPIRFCRPLVAVKKRCSYRLT